MLFKPRAPRTTTLSYYLRPLGARALVAAACLLPLACADHDATEPTRRAAGTARPSADVTPLPPIFIEPLTGRYAFTDQVTLQTRIKLDGRATNVVDVPDPSNVTVLRITVQPGARFPWHTHPGPVFVSVAQGQLNLVYGDDCIRRPYAQAVFVDPGNSVHMAYNPGATETVLYATFFDVPPTGPITIALPADQQTALDAKCDAAPAAAHAH